VALTEFPVIETEHEKMVRTNRKFFKLVRINAKAFRNHWENEHRELLAYSANRLGRIIALQSFNAYPQVTMDKEGNIDVFDGRHRIALVAIKGMSLQVAVHKKTILPHHLIA